MLVLVGDAGLQYTMQELPLASELGLDVRMLLWNNHRLEQIRDDMNAVGIQPVGVTQKNPDFGMLAAACGWEHAIVDRLGALDEALEQLFATPGPGMLEIAAQEMFPPPG